MTRCETCGKNKFIDFGRSECESCTRKRYAVKDGKEIYGHIAALMKECNIPFEQALEIIKIVNLHDILEELERVTKAVYAIEE